jgi:hypothetical protein
MIELQETTTAVPPNKVEEGSSGFWFQNYILPAAAGWFLAFGSQFVRSEVIWLVSGDPRHVLAIGVWKVGFFFQTLATVSVFPTWLKYTRFVFFIMCGYWMCALCNVLVYVLNTVF